MEQDNQFLKWAKDLQSIAQAGLEYGKDIFDKDRYEKVREIAGEMMQAQTGLPKEKIDTLFLGDEGYQTPKIDTRAAIFKDDKILLVREKSTQTWSLPGGWNDYDCTTAENCAKEAREEGFDDIAEKFEGVGAIEKEHEARYLKLLDNVKKEIVFSRDGDTIWQCANCGHICIGKKAPDVCPVCDHPQAYFQIKAENF